MFVSYSEAHVHTLTECVKDVLEQQNSGTAVNDRYMKLTFWWLNVAQKNHSIYYDTVNSQNLITKYSQIKIEI